MHRRIPPDVQPWKWDEAEQSFKRAIELKPGYAAAYQWYGNLLAITGRLDEAKEMLRRGLEIDPASHNLINDLGQFYYFSRDYDKAIELCQKALEIYPEFSFAYNNLEVIYLNLRRFEECFDVTEKLGSITARNWSNADIKPKTGKEALQIIGGWEKYVRDEISSTSANQTLQSWRTQGFMRCLATRMARSIVSNRPLSRTS
jgi:tetratricopeptide (TPR) repeat protein